MIVVFYFFLGIIIIVQLRSLFAILVNLFIKDKNLKKEVDPNNAPEVLIQIPVYNEGWEVKDAVFASLNQNYPADRLCVQVIDDSEARFPDLVEALTKEAASKGITFMYLNRPHREGYKSGALNYGMELCKHEFILVLDADFVIEEDFLKRCVPHLEDKELAGVQTRWSYRNAYESAIITVQSTIFHSIFAMEQCLREKLNISAFFTGTSGIWRRSVIEKIGGWREKPFTAEDIDLSFRSYHDGKKFKFIDEALSNCEATPSFIAFKHQQQRWARGVIQAGAHNLNNVLTARQPLFSKLLEISTVFYNVLPLSLLLISFLLSLFAFNSNYYHLQHLNTSATFLTALILLGPTSLGIFYSELKYNTMSFSKIYKLILAGLLGVGLALSMIFGLWEVVSKSKKEFVVTPKGENKATIKNKKSKWLSNSYMKIILELLVFVYFLVALVLTRQVFPAGAIIFLLMSLSGLFSFISSMRGILKN